MTKQFDSSFESLSEIDIEEIDITPKQPMVSTVPKSFHKQPTISVNNKNSICYVINNSNDIISVKQPDSGKGMSLNARK